jgi:hypothetical protein
MMQPFTSILRSILCVGACLSFFNIARAQEPVVQLDDWQQTVAFDGPRTSLGGVVVGNRMYLFGGLHSAGNDFTLYDDVQYATLGNDGSVAAPGWQRTESFSTPRSGLGVTVSGNVVYVVGGYSKNGTVGDVQYARFNADGTLGKWTTSPNRLNVPRSNHRLEVHTTPSGKLYLAAIAGVGDIGSDTVHFDNIEVAPIASDGSVGTWMLCPFHLKGGRSAPATAIIKGRLYVIGGWGDRLLEDVFSDVQFAPIRDDGCTDPWLTNPYALNMPSYGHAAIAASSPQTDAVIILGGNVGQGTYLNAVQTAAIGPSGSLARWFLDMHQFATARWGHVALRYGNFIYVVGGAQRGSGGYLRGVQFTKFTLH